ncbi:MAG: penicillin-binding transpeptidase domain-containing protein [Solirubrobacteraceae bacterium]|jgi:penicillin-binding protein 2
MIAAPPPPEERRSPLTPQLALRVAIVGSVALAMFAIIFFRLWFLQVLSGDQYLAQAANNRVREIAVAAPRGEILDRGGNVLVDSNRALAVQIAPPDLPVPATLADITTLEHPPRPDAVVYNRLAHVLGMSTKRIRCQLHMPSPNVYRLSPIACDVGKQVTLLSYADVTIKSGTVVTPDVQYYLAERQSEFPGVQVERVYVTNYPLGDLAAQVLGTVGPINPAEHDMKAYRAMAPNSIIGQSGLEYEYNSFLSGTQGEQKVQINALGQPTGDLPGKSPQAGDNLRTSLDVQLERVGQNALQESMGLNASPGGAFVALDPDSGQVYGMGSLPSYDPSVFAGSNLSESAYQQLINPDNGDPLLNRADQSAGPTGSAFKVITATAALQSGDWLVDDTYDDTGQFCFSGTTDCLHNSGHAANGVVNLVSAIRVSDDVFFYHLGALTNVDVPQGGPLQQWARKFGIGRDTGIDLPGEVSGTLPSPAWRAARNALELECENATGPFRYTNGKINGPRKLKGWYRSPKHPASAGGCGIADGNPWTIGDNVNLAVGQGDVQVTPLQLAVVYAALANGGKIVRPHIGLDVQSEDGTVLQKIDPPATRNIDINPLYLETIREGLREAASAPGGTSADVFNNFPEQVYGKTGTAQYITDGVENDYAWYACFVPAGATTKPIVVVVTVEKGGFGAVAAAPVAREILSQWFFGKPGPYQAGSSATL